jgi:hypothetical protein
MRVLYQQYGISVLKTINPLNIFISETNRIAIAVPGEEKKNDIGNDDNYDELTIVNGVEEVRF